MRPNVLGLWIVFAVGLGGCGSSNTPNLTPTPTPGATPTPSPTPAPLPAVPLRSLTVGTGTSARLYEAGFLVTNLTDVDQTLPLDQQAFVPTLSSNLTRVEDTTTSAATTSNSQFACTTFFEQLSSPALPARLQTLVVRFANDKSFTVGQTYTPNNDSTQVTLYYQKNTADTGSFVGYIGHGGTVRIVGISGGMMSVAVEGVSMEPYLPSITGHFTLTAVLKIPFR